MKDIEEEKIQQDSGKCPVCRESFCPGYRFCPYDGVELQFQTKEVTTEQKHRFWEVMNKYAD